MWVMVADGVIKVRDVASRILRGGLARARRLRRFGPARLRMGYRAVPASRVYGFDRGLPVDRWYIEDFLTRFAPVGGYASGTIGGRVLEIGGREYADRFVTGAGGAPPQVDVLHADASNPEATIVGDLTDPGVLEEGAYDCIICTQTLQVIWDVPAALGQLHRALRAGGALLVTVPGISAAMTPDRDHWGDWWRFTSGSVRRLAEEAFPGGDIRVEAYGNLLAATCFLHGLAVEELTQGELELRDPAYEVIVALRATKAG